MTIASEIQRIKTNISNAYTACDGKGATMPTTQNSANLATCINSITGGSGSETRKLTIKLINTMGSEGEGHCNNGEIFPSQLRINQNQIYLNDCVQNGFTYSMYVPNAVYDMQNLYCITYQEEFSKDARIIIVVTDPLGNFTQAETNSGVVNISNGIYSLDITLSEDTIIKLFWGFDQDEIYINPDDPGDII